MKADREKTSGAKIALSYNAKDDYLRELEKERYFPENHGGAKLSNYGYVVALGPKFGNNPETMEYAGEAGSVTPKTFEAKTFDTWAEAMRYALDNPSREVLNVPNIRECVIRGYGKK